jgi:hypothetical protein
MLIGGLVVVIEVLNVVVSGGQVVLQRLAQQLATIAGLPSPVVRVAWRNGEGRQGTSARSQESREALRVNDGGQVLAGPVGRVNGKIYEQVSRPRVGEPVLVLEGVRGATPRPRAPEQADADRSEAVAIERRRREGAVAERWRDLNAGAVDGRYYGVAVGKAPGVYTSWALAREQVHRVSGNSHRCFTQLHYALGYIREHQVQTGIDEDILQYDNFGNVIARWRYAVPVDRVNGNAWSQRLD